MAAKKPKSPFGAQVHTSVEPATWSEDNHLTAVRVNMKVNNLDERAVTAPEHKGPVAAVSRSRSTHSSKPKKESHSAY